MTVAVDKNVAKMNTFHPTITIVPKLTILLPTSENIGNPCAVYAGNLSWSTTEEQLLSFAGADRGAISAEIKRHKDTKRSKGWGYGSNQSDHKCHLASLIVDYTISFTQLDPLCIR